MESVRSSLAKHLGLSSEQPYPTSDRSEGLAAMMMDAPEEAAEGGNLEKSSHLEKSS